MKYAARGDYSLACFSLAKKLAKKNRLERKNNRRKGKGKSTKKDEKENGQRTSGRLQDAGARRCLRMARAMGSEFWRGSRLEEALSLERVVKIRTLAEP